jgi:integrase
VVLTRSEVDRLLARLDGTHALMAGLMYGTGMRLMECVRLRVKDVDFEGSKSSLDTLMSGRRWFTPISQPRRARRGKSA